MAKRGDPWFKFFPNDWLEDTRHLTLEQRGAYIDAIALQMATERPLPVGLKKNSNRGDYRWLAHKLHVSERKAEAVVSSLVDAMMLRHVAGGLSNQRCEREISARHHQRQVNQENGAQGGRPAAKAQDQSDDQGGEQPAANAGSASAQRRPEAGPASSQGRLSLEPTLGESREKSEKSKNANKNKRGDAKSVPDRFDTRTGAHARLDSDPESEKKEGSPNGDSSPDGDRSPARGGAIEAFEAYNATAARCGLPQASRLTPDRETKIKVRLRHYGMDGWMRALANIERSPFLRGHNDRGWRASLDFMLQASSFAKLHDGGYANKAPAVAGPQAVNGTAAPPLFETAKEREIRAANDSLEIMRQRSEQRMRERVNGGVQ